MLRSGWPGGARFDAERQLFFVPGSWLPLGLMMGIFTAKFALGMSLAMQPAVAHNIVAAVGFSATFGLLSGALLGRSRTILDRRGTVGRCHGHGLSDGDLRSQSSHATPLSPD